MTIRLATPNDAEAIANIYAPVVRETPISFEFDPPDGAEMRERIERTLPAHPWLVYERADGVVGYAYAGLHRKRAAYRWSVDVSVYVHEENRGEGVGRALYESLFAVLRLQGFYNAYAGITLPNPASVGLHRSMGFERVGVYEQVGYKYGEWHDVSWWVKTLREHESEPEPPLSLDAVRKTDEFTDALAVGVENGEPR